MKVIVLGSNVDCHALIWRLTQFDNIEQILVSCNSFMNHEKISLLKETDVTKADIIYSPSLLTCPHNFYNANQFFDSSNEVKQFFSNKFTKQLLFSNDTKNIRIDNNRDKMKEIMITVAVDEKTILPIASCDIVRKDGEIHELSSPSHALIDIESSGKTRVIGSQLYSQIVNDYINPAIRKFNNSSQSKDKIKGLVSFSFLYNKDNLYLNDLFINTPAPVLALLMRRAQFNWVDLLQKGATNNLDQFKVDWSSDLTFGVVSKKEWDSKQIPSTFQAQTMVPRSKILFGSGWSEKYIDVMVTMKASSYNCARYSAHQALQIIQVQR